MNQVTQLALRELKAGLQAIYGPRLRGVYLFGSYARDEADEESDVDVLIVIDRIGRYSEEIERTASLMSALSLAHGHSISCVFASEEQWRRDRTMFLQNVREEAIPV